MTEDLSVPKKNILVVDDDESIRSFVRYSLDNEGFDVTEKSNGVAALKLLEKGPCPDLILLDVMMPGKDGFETLKAIRAESKWDKIPVILMTGHPAPENKKKAKEAGAQGFMEKPLRFNELLRQIFDGLNGNFSVPTRIKYS